MCTLSISNVIYHKFSHGASFYTLNGKNVNVMLELTMSLVECLLNSVELTKSIAKILFAGNCEQVLQRKSKKCQCFSVQYL